MTFLGITGTNGKTTTAFLLESILRAAGRTTGMIGSLNARIAGRPRRAPSTTPEPPRLFRLLAEMRAARVDTVVMEVTSHALALHRVDGISFAVATFTNLAPEHLDFHRDLDEYFAAKRQLFAAERTRRGAVNIDDPYGKTLLANGGVPCLTFGLSAPSEVRADRVKLSGRETRFRLHTPVGRTKILTPLLGRFNVYNCLAATASALQAGISLDEIAIGLQRVTRVPGRFERIHMGQPFEVVVDFAQTPEALGQTLEAARLLTRGRGRRVLCVCGVHGDADPAKRPRMGAVAAELADEIVLTLDSPGLDDPERITDEMLAGALRERPGARITVEPERGAAIDRAVEMAGPGDVLIVAGRGTEPFLNVLGYRVHFDDRAVLRRALARRGWKGSS